MKKYFYNCTAVGDYYDQNHFGIYSGEEGHTKNFYGMIEFVESVAGKLGFSCSEVRVNQFNYLGGE